jgi:murein DD-endopeptidase MepM/ murein hydrolase activator NlpD
MTIRGVGNGIILLVLLGMAAVFYLGIIGKFGTTTVAVPSSDFVNPAGPAGPREIGSVTVGPAGLALPVAGVKPGQLVDTFTQARAGGARIHDAIDIMAPAGTPVVAAAPGRVEKLFFSAGGGGISAYIRSEDERWSYYYAHLNGYAPGLREGQRVDRGTPIGIVGWTGNASPDGPHLHFAVNRMEPGDKWHQGTPVNPYPLLAGTRPSR